MLSREAVVRRHNAVDCAQGMRREHRVGVAVRGIAYQIGSPVGRAAIGIDQHCSQAGEITGKGHVNGANDIADRLRVVQGGKTDKDIDLSDGDEVPE